MQYIWFSNLRQIIKFIYQRFYFLSGMDETKIHVNSGPGLAEEEVRKTSSAKVKKNGAMKESRLSVLGTYYPVKIHGGKVPWIVSACRRYRESI